MNKTRLALLLITGATLLRADVAELRHSRTLQPTIDRSIPTFPAGGVSPEQRREGADRLAAPPRRTIHAVILNNLRQLAAAAEQHYLENGGTTARYEDLVGPEKYIEKLTTIDGEDYRSLDFNFSTTNWKIVSASGVVVTYKLR